MVSFNGIKNYVIELFYHDFMSIKSCLARLFNWFMMNPTLTNRDRETLSQKNSTRISLNYYKRTKKFCF